MKQDVFTRLSLTRMMVEAPGALQRRAMLCGDRTRCPH